MNHQRLIRGFDACVGILLVSLIVYYTIGQSLLPEAHWPPVDYDILYNTSRAIVDAGAYSYPPSFLYPPSAVILLYITALVPKWLAGLFWMGLTIVATIGTFVLGTSLVGLKGHPWRWTLAMMAFGAMEHYIAWDLRCQNCNMVYCFLLTTGLWALARDRATLSGAMLSLGVALKLYPALVVGYLLMIGRRRAFFAAAAGAAILFAGLPLAYFGPSGAVKLYLSWMHHVQFMLTWIQTPDEEILNSLPIIALKFTLRTRLNLDPTTVAWLTYSLAAVWLAVVGLCWLARRPWTKAKLTGWDLAVDGALLAVGPTMLSPYLESYHMVPATLLVLALLELSSHVRLGLPLRWLALMALGLGWTAVKVSGRLDYYALTYRGLGVYTQMVLLLLALATLRWVASRPTPAATAPREVPAPKHRLLARSNAAARASRP
jgi:hypothetical protein